MSDPTIDELRKKMLHKQLWVIMSRRVVPPEQLQPHVLAHLQHQIKLEKQGILYGAGPATLPGAAEASFGLIIIRAKDEDEARRIADSDPVHVHGLRKYELYQWSMNEGSLNITLIFSDQTYRLD